MLFYLICFEKVFYRVFSADYKSYILVNFKSKIKMIECL